jgi:subtilisin family serine protease
MRSGRRPPRGPRLLACGLLCAASLALASSTAAAKTGPPSGLSPRLAELASPALRDAPKATQAKALGLAPSGPGSLLRGGTRVLVYVRFDHGAIAALPAIRAAGGEVVDSSRRRQTATVAVRPDDLKTVAGVAGVAAVTEAHAPVTAAAECPSGEVVSEGVQQLDAGEEPGEARDEFSVDGSGVTVGILSDSFDAATEAVPGGPVATHALEDEESGDLPGSESPCTNQDPVEVLDEFEPFGEEAFDEGRGMAQIVHDMAPGADISFATAFEGEESFASNIEELAKEGAGVLADDVFYFEEPFFQDGPVAVAVNKTVESGSTYFSAAGNDSMVDSEGHQIASWETPEFRDTGSCPAEVKALGAEFNASHCLDFNPGLGVDKTFGIKVEGHEFLTIDLQWDEPWNGVKSDLDAFLLDANGHLVEFEAINNLKTQQPTEIMQWSNSSSSTRTVQLVINRFAGENPRLKFGLLQNGGGVAGTEYPQSAGEDVAGPTIFGHSGAAAAISVGAIRFNTKSAPEPYSSQGPVQHDFGPVEGSEPAEALSSPEILSKPDIIATDCGQTTFFASFSSGVWRFCGTSAAAPHAAGVAALMLDEKLGGAGPEEVRSALQSSAHVVGSFEACAVGSGLIDATGAIEDLLSPPSFTPAECVPPEPVPAEEARAPGEWGLEAPPSVPIQEPVKQVVQEEPVPKTFFRHKPLHLIRTHGRIVHVVFVFGSDQEGATFACRIDGGLFRRCGPRLTRRFGLGSHSLRVFARNASGIGDSTPAVYRFRVKRVGG